MEILLEIRADEINDIELNDELLSIAEGLIDSLFMTGQQ